MKIILFLSIVLLSFLFLACELPEDKEKECKPAGREMMKTVLIACSNPTFVSEHGYVDSEDCTHEETSKDGVFIFIMNCFGCEEDEEACL